MIFTIELQASKFWGRGSDSEEESEDEVTSSEEETSSEDETSSESGSESGSSSSESSDDSEDGKKRGASRYGRATDQHLCVCMLFSNFPHPLSLSLFHTHKH